MILYLGTQEAEELEALLMAVAEEPMVGMERIMMGLEVGELVKTSLSTPSDPGS